MRISSGLNARGAILYAAILFELQRQSNLRRRGYAVMPLVATLTAFRTSGVTAFDFQ